MHDTATMERYTLDSIIEQLDTYHQRATYGAVAGVVNTAPRTLMQGRERDQRDSWVVNRQTGEPTGYAPEQLHDSLTERDTILSTPESLRRWLEDPS
jgi:hypothetical protein